MGRGSPQGPAVKVHGEQGLLGGEPGCQPSRSRAGTQHRHRAGLEVILGRVIPRGGQGPRGWREPSPPRLPRGRPALRRSWICVSPPPCGWRPRGTRRLFVEPMCHPLGRGRERRWALAVRPLRDISALLRVEAPRGRRGEELSPDCPGRQDLRPPPTPPAPETATQGCLRGSSRCVSISAHTDRKRGDCGGHRPESGHRHQDRPETGSLPSTQSVVKLCWPECGRRSLVLWELRKAGAQGHSGVVGSCRHF